MNYKTLLKEYAIALTGGIACGKSTVAAMIRDEGFLVIDADQVARQVVSKGSKGLDLIVRTYGTSFLNEDGQLDRSKLRALISSNQEAKEKLESITHPLIFQETEKILKENSLFENPTTWFYEAALIYEISRENQFKEVWVMYCDQATQIARVMTRDSTTKVEAEKIINIQMPAAKKAKLADFVINTDEDKSEVKSRVQAKLIELKEAP